MAPRRHVVGAGHDLPLDVGHDPDHPRRVPETRHHPVEIGDAARPADHGGMAVNAQHAVEQLGAEAVHDREHDDQRADAERDADQAKPGDDRDEALAPGRPQVPPGDQALETTEGHQPAKRSSSSTGEISTLARGAALELDLVLLDPARADDDLPGQPDQLHGRELDAGPLVAVVHQDLDAQGARRP